MEEKNTPQRPARRSPISKNRKRQGQYLTILLLGCVALFLILSLCIKDQSFSESENRNLAQFPKLTWSTLKDGSFFTDLSSYSADQFPGRDLWITLDLKLNQFLGQKEVSGVYLSQDGYLIQIPGDPNEEQLKRNLDAINAFASSYSDLNTVVTIVPNAVTVLSDKLPKNAPARDQFADLNAIEAVLSGVKFADVSDVLLSNNQHPLYYRTDHHWTSLAAYYAFSSMAPALGISPPALETYTRYTVSDSFEGTLSSKSGSHSKKDEVEIFVPHTPIEYYVSYEGQPDICSMYVRSALDSKDHYTLFFGGNHPRVDITTTADTGRSLLILKDSYANCMVQFLYPYFDHIVMVDPRYYYDNLDNAIRSESITDVLFLYNLDTFLSDSSLADVLPQ